MCKILIYILTHLLIQQGITSNDYFSNKKYNLIKRLNPIGPNHLSRCEATCQRDANCAEWILTSTSNPNEYECYHLTPVAKYLKNQYDVSIVRHDIPFLSGGNNLYKDADVVRPNYEIFQLVDNAIATDSSSLLNFPQHFTSGCSYTISLSVWLWRRKHISHENYAIFSTRTLSKVNSFFNDEFGMPLLPAILFNLQDSQDLFFFAASKDQDGRYTGIWPRKAKVRYYSWIQFTLAIENNIMKIYMDGEYLDYISIPFPHMHNVSPLEFKRCPYNEFIYKRKYSSGHPNSQIVEKQVNFSSQIDNNVIFQLGGMKPNPSTVGMISNAFIIRNKALNAHQVFEIFQQLRPPSMPTLVELLPMYGIHSLDNYCVINWSGNHYLLLSWKICPEAVCGSLCLPDSFLKNPLEDEGILHHKLQATILSKDAASQPKLPSYQLISIKAPNELSLTSSPTRKRPLKKDTVVPKRAIESKKDSPGFDKLVKLPDIGKIRNPNLQTTKKTSNKTNLNGDNSTTNSSSLNLASSPLTPCARNFTTNYYELTFEKGSDFGASNPPNLTLSKSLSKDQTYYLLTTTGKVSSLYKMAMLWMNGRYEEEFDDFQPNLSLSEWQSEMNEKTFSAMTLALWFSDDGTHEKDQDIDWNFKYPSLLGQPIHLQLGYRTGYDYHVNDDTILEAATEKSKLIRSIILQMNNLSVDDPDVMHLRFLQLLNTTAIKNNSQSKSQQILLENQKESYTNKDEGSKAKELYEIDILSNGMSSNLSPIHINDQTKQSPEKASLNQPTVNLNNLLQHFLTTTSENFINSFAHDSIYQNLRDLGITTEELRRVLMDGNEKMNYYVKHDGHNHLSFLQNNLNEKMKSSLSTIPSPNVNAKEFIFQLVSEEKGIVDSRHVFPESQSLSRTTDSGLQCIAAASYFFPVSQYVASHHGVVESGVGLLEEISLLQISNLFHSPLSVLLAGQFGERDQQHVHTEAEALLGDPDSQTWLGKKYFWGIGGVPRDENLARQWFERAAEQNHAEGLYNIGSFYMDGKAGLAKDKKKALDYFHRAANSSTPFSYAFHALGNHYRFDETDRNLTLARLYYAKSAKAGDANGHFSLATMYREGPIVNIPLCIKHLTAGASRGHVQSINFLAHALFDSESWLAHYGREQAWTERNNEMLAFFNSSSMYGQSKNISDEFFQFNITDTMEIVLPNFEVVRLPNPIGSSVGACEASLKLMNYLNGMSYRPRDTNRLALEAYLEGNLWDALELYEEAAELGVKSAHENAAFLYEVLKNQECKLVLPNALNAKTNLKSKSDYEKYMNSIFQKWGSESNQNRLISRCEMYFDRMATKRWLHLAHLGDHIAQRKIADRYLDLTYTGLHSSRRDSNMLMDAVTSRNVTRASLLYALAAEQGDVQSLMNLGWILFSGDDEIERNLNLAQKIFEVALTLETHGKFQNWTTHALGSGGIAPLIASGLIKAEILLEHHNTGLSIRQLWKNVEFVYSYLSGAAFKVYKMLNYH